MKMNKDGRSILVNGKDGRSILVNGKDGRSILMNGKKGSAFSHFKNKYKLVKCKKAADTIVIENTIFFVLNIAFFSIMLLFVYDSGNNILVKEQSYAKEIALIIDNSKPGMSVLLNINELIEEAKKNNFPAEDIVKIDEKNSRVLVSLKKNSVFGFQYFSKDASVKLNNQWLMIEVGKK